MRTGDLELAEDAARLLGFGLRPKLRPAVNPEYQELLRRYRNEGALRERVLAVGRGLGLLVLGATDHGLVLGAHQDGPFAMTLGDYRKTTTVAERLCHGLIQLAVAAWCFPTAQDLEERDSVAGPKVSVNRLVAYLIEIAETLKGEAGDRDPERDRPELAEAWRTVLARAATRTSKGGRRSPSTLAGMVAHALESLESGGLFRRLGDDDGGTFQALGSYRVQVRELAAHDTFRLVREAASRREAT